jgi:hypothetical protein
MLIYPRNIELPSNKQVTVTLATNMEESRKIPSPAASKSTVEEAQRAGKAIGA